jgi:hypothetical protein
LSTCHRRDGRRRDEERGVDGDLQLDETERRAQTGPFRRRALVVRRVGRTVLALIVAAALFGLLGPGPLSAAEIAAPSGLVRLEYQRFTRHVADTSLQLTLSADPSRPDTAAVWISREYLSSLNVQQVVPEPESWTAAGAGVVLTFPVSSPADRVLVQLQVRADEIGLVHGSVGVPGQEPVTFWQLVHP